MSTENWGGFGPPFSRPQCVPACQQGAGLNEDAKKTMRSKERIRLFVP